MDADKPDRAPGEAAGDGGAAGPGEALRPGSASLPGSLPGGREALALLADWLSSPEPASGWGGPLSPRSEAELGGAPAPEGEGEGLAAYHAAGPASSEASSTGPDLEEDRAQVETCRACRLGEGRSHPAYGEGVPRPLVLVVGEGPGAEEDAQGRPFVGPAGRLLDKMLSSIGLSRETNCYIANIVKCRPPGNREPANDEREACLPWLERQIAALQPSFILAMGRTAATTLLRSEEGIGRLRGRWFERRGIPLLASYHPSALLRDETLKRPAWEDLKMLRFRLEEVLEAEGGASGGAERGAAPVAEDNLADGAGDGIPGRGPSFED